MADFQPTDGIIQAIVRQTTWDNQVTENVFNINFGGAALDQSDADSVADGLHGAYEELAGFIFSGNTFSECIVNDIRTEDGPGFLGDWTPIDGTNGSDPLPGQNAAIVSWKTGRRGASYRGRTFLGGMTEAQVTSGVLAAAYVTAIEAFADLIVAPGGHDFVVLSRVQNGDVLAEAIGTSITGYTIPTHFGTQRRRRT